MGVKVLWELEKMHVRNPRNVNRIVKFFQNVIHNFIIIYKSVFVNKKIYDCAKIIDDLVKTNLRLGYIIKEKQILRRKIMTRICIPDH